MGVNFLISIVVSCMQVLCWGVRNMSKYQMLAVKSPSVEVEVGGQKVQSNVIKNTSHNPNFDDPILFFSVVRNIYS